MSIVAFPGNEKTSVKQALFAAMEYADNNIFKNVIILGFDDEESLYVRSSAMSNSDALWVLKKAEMHVLGLFEISEED